MPNPKSRKVLSLMNTDWSVNAEVRREHNGTYTVDVYSQGKLSNSHSYQTIRKALISACDIVGET